VEADQHHLKHDGNPRGRGFFADERAERFGTWGIWVLIAYTALRNIWSAASRPFWYDELCTVAVASPASVSGLWNAFKGAKDSNPPLFYLIEHIARKLSGNELVAYRLPSIVAFCCVLWCIFAVIRKRNDSSIALACTSALLLTPLYRPYAIEARPYSMVVACIAIALFCYQRAPRWPWMLLMAISYATAESLHFYALFGFVPFAVSEAALFFRMRQLRLSVWFALGLGLVPLALSWPQLQSLKEFYGAHFWALPSLVRTASAYALFLKTFAPIAVAIVVVLSIVALRTMSEKPRDFSHEHWLGVALLGVPVVAFIAIKLAHGGFVERYVLLAILGVPLTLAYTLRMFGQRCVALFAVFVLVGVALQEGYFWKAESAAFGSFVSPADSVERLASASTSNDLPIVISDGHDYVPIAYYATSDWRKRFVAVVDPEKSILYNGSDSLDKQLAELQCCLPLHVSNFADFARDNPSFLLYSGGGDWDWWAYRLLDDGYSLRVLSAEKNHRLYLAGMKDKSR
jgi:mannosyltransferase